MTTLSVESLLAGSKATFRVAIPRDLLTPSDSDAASESLREGSRSASNGANAAHVVLKPLSLLDLQRVKKAAQDNDLLTSVLMVQQALTEPRMSVEQVNGLNAGLVQFLLKEVNRISGLSMSTDELQRTVQAPLARACFVLSREFGWTPEECANLSVGQVLLYLEMLGQKPGEA